VIVPKVTLRKWEREMKEWCPSLRVFVFYGDKGEKEQMKKDDLKNREFDCILTTYEVIMKEKGALKPFEFDLLIVDEAHRIKNDQSVLS
jgi:SWI/SNF-related matrix-associated actin-dependent regulator of chromatin subfamily A member 5